MVLEKIKLTFRAPDCADESVCFRYRQVLDRIFECTVSLRRTYSAIETDIEPVYEKNKVYELHCWSEERKYINLKKIDMYDPKHCDTEIAVKLMNNVFYKFFSGIMRSIELIYQSSESRVYHSIEEVNIPGTRGFVGSGYIRETGKNFTMWCDMICAIDDSSHGCNNSKSLERCLLYRSGNESVFIIGNAVRNGFDFSFNPRTPMITENFGIEYFEMILQRIGPLFWSNYRKKLY